MRAINNCEDCKNNIKGDVSGLSDKEAFVIQNRDYGRNSLLSPLSNFNQAFYKSIYILQHVLPDHCYKIGVIYFLKQVIKSNVNLDFLQCRLHNTTNIFLEYVVQFHVLTWTKNINKILKGRLQVSDTKEPIKKLAKEVHIKHKRFSAKI